MISWLSMQPSHAPEQMKRNLELGFGLSFELPFGLPVDSLWNLDWHRFAPISGLSAQVARDFKNFMCLGFCGTIT